VRLLPAGFRGIEVKANTPAAQWRIGGYDFSRPVFPALIVSGGPCSAIF
jgi:hypothetical protein